MTANVRKVTLAITSEEYAWAERSAKRAGTSISAVLSAAARERRSAEERDARQREAWAAVVAYVTNGAPLTPEELSAAEGELEAGGELKEDVARSVSGASARNRRAPSASAQRALSERPKRRRRDAP